MSRLKTEKEWRRKAVSFGRKSAAYTGPQCVYTRPKKLFKKPVLLLYPLLILLTLTTAASIPVLAPERPLETFDTAQPIQESTLPKPREISAISYDFPNGLQGAIHTFRKEQLLEGKVMLISTEHPLPAEVPAPNTMSIAAYGKGMIPVRNLKIRSGEETMKALVELFRALRDQKIQGLTVWEGTLSKAEQRQQQKEYFRSLLVWLSPDEAAEQTFKALDSPGTGELQNEYTVEIRLQNGSNDHPDERRLEESAPGQALLQTAWRYGFVRSNPQAEGREAYRFRYVGKAHAMAMTYLNLGLKEYLLWLQQKKVLVISNAGMPEYIILSEPMDGKKVEFLLPAGADYEVSLDNMGHAVVACTMKNE